MKTIPVKKNGEVAALAMVDDSDFDTLSRRSWNLMDNGYAVRGTNSRGRILMHREVMGCERGDGKIIDHINQDKLDCRRSNLRLVSHSENCRNRRASSTSTSQHLGVSWCNASGKWVASACASGKRVALGYFEDEGEAARTAREWRISNGHFAYSDRAIY